MKIPIRSSKRFLRDFKDLELNNQAVIKMKISQRFQVRYCQNVWTLLIDPSRPQRSWPKRQLYYMYIINTLFLKTRCDKFYILVDCKRVQLKFAAASYEWDGSKSGTLINYVCKQPYFRCRFSQQLFISYLLFRNRLISLLSLFYKTYFTVSRL